MVVTDGGQPRRIDVPVEVPEGVNRAVVFDQSDKTSGTLGFYAGRPAQNMAGLSPSAPSAAAQIVSVTRSGSNSAKTKGAASGTGGGVSLENPPPPSRRPATNDVMADEVMAIDGLRTLSPAEKKRVDLQSKFHPTVLAVIDRLKIPNAKPGADEAKFVRNGKAEVQIWLTEKSDETTARLKELGFEVVLDPKTAKLVIGWIPIEKLAALAELKSVRYVGPQL
jgi:hypothetical protein